MPVCQTIVTWQRVLVWKLGKHQRSKQRCQDLGWKDHDRAQSFVLRSYTLHELRNQHVVRVNETPKCMNFQPVENSSGTA